MLTLVLLRYEDPLLSMQNLRAIMFLPSPKVPQNGQRWFKACWSLPCVWSICNLLLLELIGNWRKKCIKDDNSWNVFLWKKRKTLVSKLHKNNRLNRGLQRLQLPCVLERIVSITITTIHGGEFHFAYFAISVHQAPMRKFVPCLFRVVTLCCYILV